MLCVAISVSGAFMHVFIQAPSADMQEQAALRASPACQRPATRSYSDMFAPPSILTAQTMTAHRQHAMRPVQGLCMLMPACKVAATTMSTSILAALQPPQSTKLRPERLLETHSV